MSLLITGWLWFIWSHTVVEFLAAGFEVVILDDLSNSKRHVLDEINAITGKTSVFYQGDIRAKETLHEIFSTHKIEGVVHFAAKKAVGESCGNPWLYYSVNITWLCMLTEVMKEYGVSRLVFSSSCTVYDPVASQPPFDEETASTGNSFSPYGTTKYVDELLIRDLCLHQWFSAICLRYFNPIGAHVSWRIGEDPSQPPTNLLPVIFQVLQGKRTHLEIYGDQYATPDGTCLRDYIHVVDIASAHIAAWERLSKQTPAILETVNLWTGRPTSVKDLVAIVEEVTTQNVSVRIVAARSWDVPIAYANPVKANALLDRQAKKTIADAVADGWNYICTH